MDETPRDPVPPVPTETIDRIVGRVRSEVESSGWDRPFSIWGVFGDDPLLSRSPVKIAEGSHPWDDLPGHALPEPFCAAVLATEGWDYPDRLRPLDRGALSALGPPSGLDDRVDVRIFSYIDRSGGERTLMLRYEDRDDLPHQTVVTVSGVDGRVHDVFRRYVGLPVSDGGHRVVELLGRLWLTQVASMIMDDPSTPLAVLLRSGDPLDVMLEVALFDAAEHVVVDREVLLAAVGSAESLAGTVEGAAVYSALLEGIGAVSWRSALGAAREGVFPVVLPAPFVSWCDEGLFAKTVFQETVPQDVIIDGLVMAGFPDVADALVSRLANRGWLEGADLSP